MPTSMRPALLCTLTALGCAPDDVGADSAVAAEAPTWYRDVQPLVEKSCMSCHQEGAVGGFPLTSYAEVVEAGDLVAHAVEARTMPPWTAADGCDDYVGDYSLSEHEIDTIVAWAEAGWPEGDAATQVHADVDEELGRLSRTDITLELPELYTPTTEPDDYRCFVMEWPLDEGTFVTGYDVDPGNDAIVHHVIAYIAPAETLDDFHAADAAEEGEGYTCYGGPGVIDDSDSEWLGGWAPGGAGGDFPEGTGIYVDPGSAIILQVHYNLSVTGVGQSDQTTMDFKIDDSVQFPGIIQPWANPLWLYGGSMVIPANSEGTTHSFSYAMPSDYKVWTSNVHMHELGTSGRMYSTDSEGEEDCWLEVEDWDFNWQRSYRFTEPKDVEAGDSITVECTWDNPTDSDVDWGDGTADEMCLGSFLITLP